MEISALVAGSGAVIGSLALYGIQRAIIAYLDYNRSKKQPERFMMEKGYQGGKLIFNTAIAHLEDEEARAKTIRFFDQLGNYADKGWDAGIRGLDLPKL